MFFGGNGDQDAGTGVDEGDHIPVALYKVSGPIASSATTRQGWTLWYFPVGQAAWVVSFPRPQERLWQIDCSAALGHILEDL